jgi:hypothetical protein
MSNVVQFLETLSADPRELSEEQYAVAVLTANLDPLMQQALLKRDVEAMTNALGCRATVMAFILPAEEEQEQQDGEQQNDDGDQEGPEHVQEKSSIAA